MAVTNAIYPEVTANLIPSGWTNAGFTVLGTNTVDWYFQTVTNRIITTFTNHQFIRLKIQNP
jgi:hypothetical protein